MKRLLLVLGLLAASMLFAYGYFETRRERSYQRLIEQGDAGLAAGDPFTAIEAFSGAIAIKPDSMLGYLRRGEAYRRRAELDAAQRDLRRAIQLDPTATRPLEILGDVQAARQQHDEAADSYEAYLAVDDQSPRVLYKLALARFRAGQPDSSIDLLQKAIGLHDRLAEPHYLLGLCLRDLARTSEALVSLKKAIELSPGLYPAREELVDLYKRLNKTEERLAQLETLRGLDPTPYRGIALALAYAEEGYLDRAVPLLRRTGESYPDNPQVRVALGRIWLDAAETQGDHVALGKALEALEAAATATNSSEALTLFGRGLLLSGDHARAERVLQQATASHPIDASAFYHLADAAERVGHLDVARRALLDHHALEGGARDPKRRAELVERIGDLSLRLDDGPTAVAWYLQASQSTPAGVSLLVRLSEAYWRAGDADTARATLAKALERDPAHPAARALQRRLR